MTKRFNHTSTVLSILQLALFALAYVVLMTLTATDGFGQVQIESLTDRPFLGHASSGTPGVTALGIHLRPQGFAHIKENKITKSHAWLIRHNYLAVLSQFDAQASATDQMFDQLDEDFIAARDRVIRCGYPQAANLSPSLLTITVEQGAFNDSAAPGFSLAGICNCFQPTSNIRVAIFNLKQATELQDYRSLWKYEILNWFQCRLVGCSPTIQGEWGGNGLGCQ